jgi:hypothetical protein
MAERNIRPGRLRGVDVDFLGVVLVRTDIPSDFILRWIHGFIGENTQTDKQNKAKQET